MSYSDGGLIANANDYVDITQNDLTYATIVRLKVECRGYYERIERNSSRSQGHARLLL